MAWLIRSFDKFRPALSGVAVSLAATALAGPAAAQAPEGPKLAFGPPIAGVCLFGQAAAIDGSKAGVSAGQQIAAIQKSMEAELKAKGDAITNDDQALAAQKASMPAAEYSQKVAALRQRYNDFYRLRQVRGDQIARTRKDVLAQVAKALTPSLVAAVNERHCSVIFERNGTYGSAPGMDITAAVVERMDAALPSLTVTLAPEAAAPAR